MDIDNHGLEDDLKALEHRLTAWRPTAGALDRDRMLYNAGQAAAQRRQPRPVLAAGDSRPALPDRRAGWTAGTPEVAARPRASPAGP